jgi:hypothetical protein
MLACQVPYRKLHSVRWDEIPTSLKAVVNLKYKVTKGHPCTLAK